MSAGTRHPAIEQMLQGPGIWAVGDTRDPDAFGIACFHEGQIRALSIDQVLAPERFPDTATFLKLDLTGEDRAIAQLAFAKLADVTLALCDEDTPNEKIESFSCGDALVEHAAKIKLTADLANAAQQRYAEALAFYADEKNHVTASTGFAHQYDPEPSAIATDKGKRARAALAWDDGPYNEPEIPCAT